MKIYFPSNFFSIPEKINFGLILKKYNMGRLLTSKPTLYPSTICSADFCAAEYFDQV